jgi:ATP-dependent RNA helicase DeaD
MNFDREYRVGCFYGGNQNVYENINKLQRGVEVIVGTPGRLLDLQRRGALKFNDLKCFILDETDQMLNQGFEKDIEDIIASVKNDLERERKSLKDI